MTETLQAVLAKLSKINRAYSEVIEAYDNHMQEKVLSENYRRCVIGALIRFCQTLRKKDLFSVTKEDMQAFLNTKRRPIESDPEQRWIRTYNDYLAWLTTFFRWLYNKDKPINDWQTPNCVKISRIKSKRLTSYSPSDIWSVDDIIFITKYCNNSRDKALLTCMFDLAGRNHEVTKLRIKDIVFKENYAEAMVHWDTKTGMRPAPLIISFPYLKAWLNEHQFNGIGDFVVFPSLTTWKHLDPDSIWTVTKGLKIKLERMLMEGKIRNDNERNKIKELLKKPWNPYLMGRHSSLTEKANVLTEFQLKKYAGWSVNSKRPSTYVHLSGREIKDPLLSHYGLEKEVEKPKVKHQICGRCGFVNPLHYKLCEKCGYILNVKGFEEMQEKEKHAEKQLEELQKLATFQIHIFAQHGGKPSKNCGLCKRMMSKFSMMRISKHDNGFDVSI